MAKTSNATVRFSVDAGPQPDVTALDFNRFNPDSCEGATAQVDLRGNSSGDPSRPASELLSTLDSTKSACTGVELPTAVTIHDGAIHLTTCGTARQLTAPGAPADLHDLTLVVIKIAGAETSISVGSGGGKCTSIQESRSCVLGEKVTRGLGSTGSNRGGDTSFLPFTGAEGALTALSGALILLLGTFLTVLNRRRRNAVQP